MQSIGWAGYLYSLRPGCRDFKCLAASMPRDGPLVIQQVFAVSGAGLRKPWLPTTKVVDGVTYIKLDKWDRGLCMYVTGKALQLKSTKNLHHVNVPGFQDLLDKRQAACNSLLHRQMQEAAEQAGEELKKVRRAREEDKFIAGSSVFLDLPAMNYEQHTVPATRMQVLWSVKQPENWMELSVENLNYVKVALLSTMPQEEHCRRRKTLRNPGQSPRRKRKARAAIRDQEPVAPPVAPLPELPEADEEHPPLAAPDQSSSSSSES